MTTIDSMFELAIELRDNGEVQDAIRVLSKILTDYPAGEKTHVIYSVLAGVYAGLEEHNEALVNFKKATELNPKSELASLGVYVALANLNKDVEAVQELIRFLKNNPANLYRDTLEELLVGLQRGYMTDYENEIRNLAKINGVTI